MTRKSLPSMNSKSILQNSKSKESNSKKTTQDSNYLIPSPTSISSKPRKSLQPNHFQQNASKFVKNEEMDKTIEQFSNVMKNINENVVLGLFLPSQQKRKFELSYNFLVDIGKRAIRQKDNNQVMTHSFFQKFDDFKRDVVSYSKSSPFDRLHDFFDNQIAQIKSVIRLANNTSRRINFTKLISELDGALNNYKTDANKTNDIDDAISKLNNELASSFPEQSPISLNAQEQLRLIQECISNYVQKEPNLKRAVLTMEKTEEELFEVFNIQPDERMKYSNSARQSIKPKSSISKSYNHIHQISSKRTKSKTPPAIISNQRSTNSGANSTRNKSPSSVIEKAPYKFVNPNNKKTKDLPSRRKSYTPLSKNTKTDDSKEKENKTSNLETKKKVNKKVENNLEVKQSFEKSNETTKKQPRKPTTNSQIHKKTQKQIKNQNQNIPKETAEAEEKYNNNEYNFSQEISNSKIENENEEENSKVEKHGEKPRKPFERLASHSDSDSYEEKTQQKPINQANQQQSRNLDLNSKSKSDDENSNQQSKYQNIRSKSESNEEENKYENISTDSDSEKDTKLPPQKYRNNLPDSDSERNIIPPPQSSKNKFSNSDSDIENNMNKQIPQKIKNKLNDSDSENIENLSQQKSKQTNSDSDSNSERNTTPPPQKSKNKFSNSDSDIENKMNKQIPQKIKNKLNDSDSENIENLSQQKSKQTDSDSNSNSERNTTPPPQKSKNKFSNSDSDIENNMNKQIPQKIKNKLNDSDSENIENLSQQKSKQTDSDSDSENNEINNKSTNSKFLNNNEQQHHRQFEQLASHSNSYTESNEENPQKEPMNIQQSQQRKTNNKNEEEEIDFNYEYSQGSGNNQHRYNKNANKVINSVNDSNDFNRKEAMIDGSDLSGSENEKENQTHLNSRDKNITNKAFIDSDSEPNQNQSNLSNSSYSPPYSQQQKQQDFEGKQNDYRMNEILQEEEDIEQEEQKVENKFDEDNEIQQNVQQRNLQRQEYLEEEEQFKEFPNQQEEEFEQHRKIQNQQEQQESDEDEITNQNKKIQQQEIFNNEQTNKEDENDFEQQAKNKPEQREINNEQQQKQDEEIKQPIPKQQKKETQQKQKAKQQTSATKKLNTTKTNKRAVSTSSRPTSNKQVTSRNSSPLHNSTTQAHSSKTAQYNSQGKTIRKPKTPQEMMAKSAQNKTKTTNISSTTSNKTSLTSTQKSNKTTTTTTNSKKRSKSLPNSNIGSYTKTKSKTNTKSTNKTTQRRLSQLPRKNYLDPKTKRKSNPISASETKAKTKTTTTINSKSNLSKSTNAIQKEVNNKKQPKNPFHATELKQNNDNEKELTTNKSTIVTNKVTLRNKLKQQKQNNKNKNNEQQAKELARINRENQNLRSQIEKIESDILDIDSELNRTPDVAITELQYEVERLTKENNELSNLATFETASSVTTETIRAYEDYASSLKKGNQSRSLINNEIRQLIEKGTISQTVVFANPQLIDENKNLQREIQKTRSELEFNNKQRASILAPSSSPSPSSSPITSKSRSSKNRNSPKQINMSNDRIWSAYSLLMYENAFIKDELNFVESGIGEEKLLINKASIEPAFQTNIVDKSSNNNNKQKNKKGNTLSNKNVENPIDSIYRSKIKMLNKQIEELDEKIANVNDDVELSYSEEIDSMNLSSEELPPTSSYNISNRNKKNAFNSLNSSKKTLLISRDTFDKNEKKFARLKEIRYLYYDKNVQKTDNDLALLEEEYSHLEAEINSGSNANQNGEEESSDFVRIYEELDRINSDLLEARLEYKTSIDSFREAQENLVDTESQLNEADLSLSILKTELKHKQKKEINFNLYNEGAEKLEQLFVTRIGIASKLKMIEDSLDEKFRDIFDGQKINIMKKIEILRQRLLESKANNEEEKKKNNQFENKKPNPTLMKDSNNKRFKHSEYSTTSEEEIYSENENESEN